MKDELIKLETAKLAKEKGFDCKVSDHYKGIDLINNGLPYNFNNPKEQELWSLELNSAPTQSLLQRWLREVHKIDIEIEGCWVDHTHTKVQYVGVVLYKAEHAGLPNESTKDEDYKNTYEEALEDALVGALNYI